MKLTEIGRKLSKKDILEMEAKIKLLFPKDYAAFLCETNGGVPEEDVEFSYRAEEPECDEETILGSDVQYFYNAEEAMEAYANLTAENLIAATYFPIACDSFGNEILLSLCEKDYGCVCFADCESETENTLWMLVKVANTFSEFIDSLEITDDSI